MWSKSHTIVSKEVSKEQMWKLFADINNWQTWDTGVEFAQLEGKFEKGNFFTFRPKGAPTLRLEIVEAVENQKFTDLTRFFGAKMYGEHIFEETSEGLKITTRMTVKGVLAFLWVKIVAQNIVNALPEDMKLQIETAKKL